MKVKGGPGNVLTKHLQLCNEGRDGGREAKMEGSRQEENVGDTKGGKDDNNGDKKRKSGGKRPLETEGRCWEGKEGGSHFRT